MNEETSENLLDRDEFANYGLRAAFFSRKLHELRFLKAWQEVQKLRGLQESFDWSQRQTWGITEIAWSKAEQSGLVPILCFLHPRVLSEQPRLLLYYRSASLLSQKGLQGLSGISAGDIETGKRASLSAVDCRKLALAVNSIMSVVLSSLDHPSQEHLKAFLYASAGAQIQGSWNNAIGEQGETVVKQLIVDNLREELVQVVWKDDTSVDAEEISPTELRDRVSHLKVLRLTDGFHCVFGSEPDVSLRDPKDKPLLAVEVKAGTDPAGALERLGAAMKSFENDRSLNPRVKTVYVASCITEEVRHRIDQTRPFDYTFLLSQLLGEATVQKRFAGLFIGEIVKLRQTRVKK